MVSKYVRKTPVIIDAEQITEEMYSGYVNVCAHCLSTLLFIDERREEDAFKDADFCCDYEDDGHCMKKEYTPCNCLRKIGYVKVGDRWAYPMVGDYMVTDENGKITFMPAEKFESMFEVI